MKIVEWIVASCSKQARRASSGVRAGNVLAQLDPIRHI